MPAKSKQQQKFFGVVKAMQSGDIPKKGEAGKVAKDMSKKEVDKYASTKHKGLPKKVKKETMKISDIKKMVDEELQNVLENLNDPVLKKLRTSAPGTKFPPITTWWEAQPEDLLGAVYHSKGMLPPSDPAKFEKAYNNIAKQLHKRYPIPADVLPTLDLDDRTEREIAMDAPGINEAKSANALRADYDKAVKKEQALSSLLLVNLEKFKAAKANGDEKAIAKHTKIAGDLSKKKKVATEKASKAYKAYQDKITGLHSDAELELKEGKLNEGRGVMDLIKDAVEELMFDSNISEKEAAMELVTAISDEYQFDAKLKEGINEVSLPKFKTPYEAFSWIMGKREEAMDIETEMMQVSNDIIQTQKDMEQEASPEGGPTTDRFGSVLNNLELKHRNLRKQFNAVMAEIDEYDQNY